MTSRDTIGRQPLTIIEIDQDFCTLTYGVAPCTAALGVTGDFKCYNTLKSCQDTDNFTLGTLTLRFGVAMEDNGLGKTVNIIPSLVDVDTLPTEINVGGSNEDSGALGRRATITATFNDHPYHDRLVDKYTADRDFDPMTRGTFWAKWLARNPYHQGRSLRVLEGYVGQTLGEMTVRHYVIERIEGPDNGVVKVIAQDPLKLLNDSRATVPAASRGVLNANIDEDDTAITLTPVGVGPEYNNIGYARIGSEIVSYNFSGSSDNAVLTGRGLFNTVAEAHNDGDVFQVCYVIDGVRVDLVLQELIVDCAGIDPSFIDAPAWAAETVLWLSGFDLQAVISEPTGVAALVSEIVQQASCFIWWDERNQEIEFRAVRPYYPLIDELPISVTEEANIVADSVTIEPKPDERISQVMIYYNQINPTAGRDDPGNYARLRVLIDQDAEEPLLYGSKRIKTIFARFLGDAGDAPAVVAGTRILERTRETPIVVGFSADAKDDEIRTGRVVRFTHSAIQDLQGAPQPTLLQIMSSREAEQGHRLEFSGRPYLSRTHYGFIMEDTAPDYGSASDDEKATGGFIADGVTGFSNGDPPYRIL